MDTPDSLTNVQQFEAFIKHAPTNKDCESFVRGFVAGVAMDCPMNVLVGIAERILELRKAELKKAVENN